MKRRRTTLVDVPEMVGPESASPESPPAGWLAAELAARDAATTAALLASLRARTASGGNGSPPEQDGWLAAELRRRDDTTAVALREAVEARLARIDDIVGR